MAQPFTPEQLSGIRAALLESARRHAIDAGVRKTSLDALTADAGIAKSTFPISHRHCIDIPIQKSDPTMTFIQKILSCPITTLIILHLHLTRPQSFNGLIQQHDRAA